MARRPHKRETQPSFFKPEGQLVSSWKKAGLTGNKAAAPTKSLSARNKAVPEEVELLLGGLELVFH